MMFAENLSVASNVPFKFSYPSYLITLRYFVTKDVLEKW